MTRIGDQTSESAREETFRRQSRPPAEAIVKSLTTRKTEDDDHYHMANIELVRSFSGEKSHYDNVPIATSSGAGDVRLPKAGDPVLVQFLRGEADAPVITSTLYGPERPVRPRGSGTGGEPTAAAQDEPQAGTAAIVAPEDGADGGSGGGGGAGGGAGGPGYGAPPLARPGDWKTLVEEGLIAIAKNPDGDRVMQFGHQPDEGGDLAAGLTVNLATGAFSLTDQSGMGLTTDGAGNIDTNFGAVGGGGGGAGYLPGGTYPSIPTGGAGGDGTGRGSPGYNFGTKKNAVNLGMDRKGNNPINSKLKAAAGNNTLIEFPPGIYRVTPEGSSGISFQHSNFGIVGTGAKRSDVRFQFPRGNAGRMFNFGGGAGNCYMANLSLDQSNGYPNVVNVGVQSSGDFYAYNIAHKGTTPNDLDMGSPGMDSYGAGWNIAMGSSAVCHIENYQFIEPEEDIEPYPDGIIGMQAPTEHAGLLELVNNHMAWRGEHNVYASRCIGDVHVKGGYYHNSLNTNMRIEGAGSWIEDAVIHVDMNPKRAAEGSKGARGLRVENNKSTASSGGRATNCDFIHTSQIPSGSSSAIVVEDCPGGFTVENCRFLFDDDTNPACEVSVPGVSFNGCHFTGSTSKAAVSGNGSTTVNNPCIQMPNSPGFTGCNVSGKKSGGCRRASK